jgi:hypothetical protein
LTGWTGYWKGLTDTRLDFRMRRDGRDGDFFWGGREDRDGLLLFPKNILLIMENPVIMSSIMYIRSEGMHRILDWISG